MHFIGFWYKWLYWLLLPHNWMYICVMKPIFSNFVIAFLANGYSVCYDLNGLFSGTLPEAFQSQSRIDPFCDGEAEGEIPIHFCAIISWQAFNTLRPRQMAAISQTTFSSAFCLKKTFWIPIEISMEFVPKSQINNIPALVQIMAWRRPDDKPLSEPMMVSLLTHICVTWPQWVNRLRWGGTSDTKISIPENAFKSIFSKMAVILFQPQCVNSLRLSDAYMHH